MFKWFQGITDIIGSFIGFIQYMVDGLVNVVKLIGKAFTAMYSFIAYMPPVLTTFLIGILSYCVIVNILNKGN